MASRRTSSGEGLVETQIGAPPGMAGVKPGLSEPYFGLVPSWELGAGADGSDGATAFDGVPWVTQAAKAR